MVDNADVAVWSAGIGLTWRLLQLGLTWRLLQLGLTWLAADLARVVHAQSCGGCTTR